VGVIVGVGVGVSVAPPGVRVDVGVGEAGVPQLIFSDSLFSSPCPRRDSSTGST
jgi:hypothetical protein